MGCGHPLAKSAARRNEMSECRVSKREDDYMRKTDNSGDRTICLDLVFVYVCSLSRVLALLRLVCNTD